MIGDVKMLSGKTAVITGASGGIGSACVELFCKNNAVVYALIHRRSEQVQNWSNGIPNGSHLHLIECDLSDENSIRNAVNEIVSRSRKVDILVNNAGTVMPSTSFQMTPISKMRELFEVNFFGVTMLTQYISRLMARKKTGSIINVSSIAAEDGTPGQYEYVTSKAAIIGSTKQLAIELGKDGIRVNAIAPGITETGMAGKINNDLMSQTMNRCIMNRKAHPAEIANAILFLASDLSSYITGQVIRVDGGLI